MLVKNLPPVEREVPHEPGNWFSFRRLSAGEMDKAEADSVKETLSRYGPETMAALSKMTPTRCLHCGRLPTDKAVQRDDEDDIIRRAKQLKEEPADPLAGHSSETLVRYGLVGWRGPDYPGDDFSDEKKKELDAPTRKWAALQVLEVSTVSEGEAVSSGDGSAPTSAPALYPSRSS